MLGNPRCGTGPRREAEREQTELFFNWPQVISVCRAFDLHFMSRLFDHDDFCIGFMTVGGSSTFLIIDIWIDFIGIFDGLNLALDLHSEDKRLKLYQI